MNKNNNKKPKAIIINKALRNYIDEICSRLSLESDLTVTAPKFIYLVILLYKSNPEKFIKHFSKLTVKYKSHLKQINKKGYKYVLKIDRIKELMKERNLSYTQLSEKVWGAKTNIYKYIGGDSIRANKSIVTNIAKALGTTIDEIAEAKKYLDL